MPLYIPGMRLRVNGRAHEVAAAEDATLLEVLRDHLHLTGAKEACGRGECGTCTILLDGDPAYACLTLAAACGEAEVTTVEGLAGNGELHRLQTAFIEHDAAQCGFCTPGQLLAAAALLRRAPRPAEEEIRRWMAGNLCRCGTYPRIVRAIEAAGRAAR